MYVCAHESLSVCNDAQGYRMIINNEDNVHKFSIKVLPLMIEKFRRSIRNKHLNDFHAFFFFSPLLQCLLRIINRDDARRQKGPSVYSSQVLLTKSIHA